MLELAKNFAEGKNLKESYAKIIQMLDVVRLRTEECFTIESLCRILKTKQEKEQMIQKIIDINAIGANSYNAFCLRVSPVTHEFPLENENPCEKEVVSIMDRYMALVHIIALMKKNEVKETKKVIEYASKVEKEFKFKTISCKNREIVSHATDVMSAGEVLAGTNLKNFNDIELLLEAINFGYREEDVYLKILKSYKNTGKLKEAMKFYNECYVPLSGDEFCTSQKKFEKILAEKLSDKKS